MNLNRVWTAVTAALVTVIIAIAGNTTTATVAADPALDAEAIRAVCLARLAEPRPLSTPQRNWLRNCRDALATPSATAPASPSPSQTPSASPSTSPTATASPSPTVSPTASPSPSPSPTVAPPAGCMPQPSACGYPDQTNTGIPPGVTLVARSGDVHFNAPGVYTGLDIAGCVYIEASNVTLRHVRIRGNCWFSVRTAGINGSWTGLVIEDSEIVLASTLNGAYGICCSNYTLTRVNIHGSPFGNAGADCVYFNTNVIVQHSFCEVGILPCAGDPACTSAHSDGMTSDGGNNVLLLHNTIRNPNRQTSAILLSTNSGSVTNTTIRDGLYAGGGYTVYCGTDSGGVDPGTVFVNNRIARDWNGSAPGYWPDGGYWGPTIHCGGLGGGNVWDDTGAPLP